ncbi:26S proteasome non-ATPase regulatory subunit 10-like isoform X3 [Penaeus vannamei]|uniref:26S proteasome non-ATPase regulatory subunit 10-like isoform X3 n=1 Tax=Penaeus vannamei TaxID=6689 RepID=UPI00387F7327
MASANSYKNLRDLAGAGDGQALRSALASLPPRAKKDFLGRHLLHQAAEEGREEVVEILVEAGADVSAKDNREWTPLHFASRYGHFAVAELLAAKGADLEAKAQYEWTPLHFASRYGHFAVAELLAAKGADLEAKTNQEWTPLHFASRYGHFAVAELLAAKGADLGAKDVDEWTPLHFASRYGHFAVAELLAAKGADLEAKDEYVTERLKLCKLLKANLPTKSSLNNNTEGHGIPRKAFLLTGPEGTSLPLGRESSHRTFPNYFELTITRLNGTIAILYRIF